LDKEETFECEVSIKNASIKDSSARLIIESEDLNLVFFGTVSKDTITVPIKSLKKYFTESDNAKIKLEVIVENNLVTPWESELIFDSYNKVEIKEIKNIKSKPLIEIKVKEDKKLKLETKTKEIEQKVVTESKKSTKSLKQKLLESVNDQVKKIQVDGKLNKQEKKELIKKLLSNDL
jgi:HSP90 family molecular chaperone